MHKEEFLIKFIKFSGWLEIGIGIGFLFMDPLFSLLDLPNSPFFSLASGVMLIILGYLLCYSARDLEKFLIIPILSCIFRYIMGFGVELYSLFTIPLLTPVWFFAIIYDITSATLTLVLLKQLGYLSISKRKIKKP